MQWPSTATSLSTTILVTKFSWWSMQGSRNQKQSRRNTSRSWSRNSRIEASAARGSGTPTYECRRTRTTSTPRQRKSQKKYARLWQRNDNLIYQETLEKTITARQSYWSRWDPYSRVLKESSAELRLLRCLFELSFAWWSILKTVELYSSHSSPQEGFKNV
jgi:hypothetical protein